MTINEVITLVAAKRNMREDELEAGYSLEQIFLKRHFDVREKKRDIDYQAALMASKTAELLAKAFGG